MIIAKCNLNIKVTFPICRNVMDSSLLDKLKLLKDNWQLVKSAKILGPHAAAFYELMTAPTTKILDKWYVFIKRCCCCCKVYSLGLNLSLSKLHWLLIHVLEQ